MAQEIERKFLVLDDSWRVHVKRRQSMQQGYLSTNDALAVRVRVAGEQAYLTIKSANAGAVRSEYEYPIPLTDGQEMLATMCSHKVEKTRHWIQHNNHLWEVDEFSGTNSGLIVAEIELHGVDEIFTSPPWLGSEVTEQRRYYNAELAQQPFSTWSE